MAYDTKELEKKALEAIKKEKLVFHDEVISHLPCSSSTYYEKKMEQSESIKEALNKNKTDKKRAIRKKWEDGDNATTQIALYKLLGEDEDRQKLSNNDKMEVEHHWPESIKVEYVRSEHKK